MRFASGQLSARYGIGKEHWLDFKKQLEFIVPEDREAIVGQMLEAVKTGLAVFVPYR